MNLEASSQVIRCLALVSMVVGTITSSSINSSGSSIVISHCEASKRVGIGHVRCKS